MVIADITRTSAKSLQSYRATLQKERGQAQHQTTYNKREYLPLTINTKHKLHCMDYSNTRRIFNDATQSITICKTEEYKISLSSG